MYKNADFSADTIKNSIWGEEEKTNDITKRIRKGKVTKQPFPIKAVYGDYLTD